EGDANAIQYQLIANANQKIAVSTAGVITVAFSSTNVKRSIHFIHNTAGNLTQSWEIEGFANALVNDLVFSRFNEFNGLEGEDNAIVMQLLMAAGQQIKIDPTTKVVSSKLPLSDATVKRTTKFVQKSGNLSESWEFAGYAAQADGKKWLKYNKFNEQEGDDNAILYQLIANAGQAVSVDTNGVISFNFATAGAVRRTIHFVHTSGNLTDSWELEGYAVPPTATVNWLKYNKFNGLEGDANAIQYQLIANANQKIAVSTAGVITVAFSSTNVKRSIHFIHNTAGNLTQSWEIEGFANALVNDLVFSRFNEFNGLEGEDNAIVMQLLMAAGQQIKIDPTTKVVSSKLPLSDATVKRTTKFVQKSGNLSESWEFAGYAAQADGKKWLKYNKFNELEGDDNAILYQLIANAGQAVSLDTN